MRPSLTIHKYSMISQKDAAAKSPDLPRQVCKSFENPVNHEMFV